MLSAAQRRQDAPESLPDRREKMNQTRMDQRRAQWKPGPETYICNFHYDGLKGPIRADPSIVPTLFKRPHDFYSQRQQGNRVDFWIVFRTVLMMVNHLHRAHLSLHSSNWQRSGWNILGLKRHVQHLKACTELAFLGAAAGSPYIVFILRSLYGFMLRKYRYIYIMLVRR